MRPDPHSYYDTEQAAVRSLEMKLDVDFSGRRLAGRARLDFGVAARSRIDLDTRDLTILRVNDEQNRPLQWELGDPDPILGSRLRVSLPHPTARIDVAYQTSPEASALQWLEPAQTKGGSQPFLFSQCQQIHARSMVPMQDTPVVRVPYMAEISVPEGLTAVMSAGPEGSIRGHRPGMRTFLFRMPQPIPSYLLALAVGRLESRDLCDRSRVYAEPETVEAAAWEFAGIEAMIQKAESLFGPYEWDRYDMIVLPPAFPFGGMENPRLTFLTPTLLAGDRSLVTVVAHELAHSWTGNLVTNATANDFWLNEGFTVWAERRIIEALEGPEAAAMSYGLGEIRMRNALDRFGEDSPYTRLRMDLDGVDPDDIFSEIAYEKGSLLVVTLERLAGRERFDRFIRSYMDRFRFTSITTEQFVEFLRSEMPDVAGQVDLKTWLYEPGLPPGRPEFRSEELEEVTRWAARWPEGKRPPQNVIERWTPQDVLLYLQRLPQEMAGSDCAWLDENLSLTGQGNYEILVAWLTIASSSGYEPALPRVREVLTEVGRMKYLRPLYLALGRHGRTRDLARETFAEVKGTYHATSRRAVEEVLAEYPA